MPKERQRRLSRLVDRSLKASTALVILLTVVAIVSSIGLLVAQHRVSTAYRILFAADAIAEDVQTMRLRMGTWVLKSDPAARDEWGHAVKAAQTEVGRLRELARSAAEPARLVDAIDHLLDERIRSVTPLLSTPKPGERDARIDVLMSERYQSVNTALTAAIRQLASYQQDRLTALEQHEDVVLSAAGCALLGLVLWSLLSLRRSRRNARELIHSLEDAFRQLERQRAELEAFTDAAPLAVFHMSRDGIPTWLNDDAEELVGQGAGDGVVDAMRNALHDEDRERVIGTWRRLLDDGTELDEIFRFRHAHGALMWAHAHACPVCVDGDITGFVAVVRDISAERALQDELDRSRHQLQRITDTVPALIARIDAQERYQFVNATYADWFGDAAPKVGQPMIEFLGENAYRRLKPIIDEAMAGRAMRFEMPLQQLHGRDFVGDVSYTPERNDKGESEGFYVLVTDVSERKRLEESLFSAKEMAQVTLDSIGDAVITTDEQGVVTFANRRAAELLERPATRLHGLPIERVVRLIDANGRPSQTSLRRAIEEQRLVDMLQPRKLLLDDGASIDVEDVAAPIQSRDGHVVGGVLVIRDVSVAQAIADRMRHLAESDALTGLPNRLVLEERVRGALAALQPAENLALLYMDLDGFKAVNDTHGHGAGDELLRQFAQRLLGGARPTDTVCRLGGDEFVALLRPIDGPEAALARARHFVAATHAPFYWQGIALNVTLSVGVACAPLHGDTLRALMRRADGALYAAKGAGKNQVMLAN